jgi:hypothetical protein
VPAAPALSVRPIRRQTGTIFEPGHDKGGHPRSRPGRLPSGKTPGIGARLPTYRRKDKRSTSSNFLKMQPDSGKTNIRNVKSKHWTRWLGVENRCVVPFNSFSEFNEAEGGDIWFGPLAASPASGPTGRRSGRSRKAKRLMTSTHSRRRTRTPRSAPSIRRQCL